jgi:hypothetical protein
MPMLFALSDLHSQAYFVGINLASLGQPPIMTVKIIPRYALGALLAMALACNANAGDKDKDKDKGGTVYSVPDGGSTVALLGLAVALVVLAQRKTVRVE